MTSDPVSRYLAFRAARFERRLRLRPMTDSEILDTALGLYRRHGWLFLRSTVVPALVCLAAIAFTASYVLPRFFFTEHAGSQAMQIGETAITLLLALFVGGPLFMIGVSYSTALVVQLASQYMLGAPLDVDGAFLNARKHLRKIVGILLRELWLSLSGVIVSLGVMMLGGLISGITPETEIWSGVLAFIGVIGMVAGAVIFLVIAASHCLAVPTAIIENIRAKQASKRSTELMKGHHYHPSAAGTAIGLYILLLFGGFVLYGGIAAAFGILDAHARLEALTAGLPLQGVLVAAFDLLPWFLVVWVLVPVWAATITILYYERRIRLEGFDIEALAAEINRTRAR